MQRKNAMSSDHHPVLRSLKHLESRFDEAGEKMTAFMASDAAGEQPDPNDFTKLLEMRSVTRRAMEAQFKLHEKPLKTVLSETK
jgi:hypothetical protein